MEAFFDLTLSDKEVKDRFGIDDYRRFVVGQYRRRNKFDKSPSIVCSIALSITGTYTTLETSFRNGKFAFTGIS